LQQQQQQQQQHIIIVLLQTDKKEVEINLAPDEQPLFECTALCMWLTKYS
jgi:hypothetical protein